MAGTELKVVIVGAGEVGKGLARGLVAEGHQVSIIDTDPALLSDVESHIDVLTIHGNGASLATLQEAGIESADLFIAVSASDEHNFLASGVAKEFGVKTTIARVRGEDYIFPDRSYYQRAMNIDFLINPDEVAAQELYDLLENPVALSVNDFAQGKLKLIGMRVGADAPICNRQLLEMPELGYHGSILIVTIVRGRDVIIPRGNTKILAGDEIYVIAETDALKTVNGMGGIKNPHLRKVVMVGASRVSWFLAGMIDTSKTRLVIIESDEQRAQKFADALDRITILQGDGTDISELTEAGVAEADGFIASAQRDETNILSALLAKEEGAQRVIALLRKPQYIPLMSHIKPIDVVINPRMATIHSILRYIRRGQVLSMASFANDEAEAVEVVMDKDSPFAGKMLKEIKIPSNVLIGAIVRGEEVIIPRGNDVLQTGDRVIVIGQKHTVDQMDDIITQSGSKTSLGRLFKSLSSFVNGSD